jgi:hypothetical protein
MRILIGVAHDTDDRNAVAADLTCDIAIEIFGGNDSNPGIGGRHVCRLPGGQTRTQPSAHDQGEN